MAYDDGYYYGQCKIVAVVDNTADNGKTVLITTDDNKTYSGTIANKKCEFLLPPRTLYTVQKVSSGSTEFTTKVEAGYGDCILVHLDTGYVEVKQGDIVGLDYIKAATADDLKNKVPEAKAVKELNNSFVERFNKNKFFLEIVGYGDRSSYSAHFGILSKGFSSVEQAYRNTMSTPWVLGLRVSCTIPDGSSGGSFTLTNSGTHTLTIEENTLGLDVPTSFTNKLTISGWTKSGIIICKLD